MSNQIQQVLGAIALWINLSALLLISGATIFRFAVWRRAAGAPERPESVERAFHRRYVRVLVWSWAAAVVASVASVGLGHMPVTLFAFEIGLLIGAARRPLPLEQHQPALVPIGARASPTPPGGPNGPDERAPRPIAIRDATMAEWAVVAGLLLTVALAGHARGSSQLVVNVAAATIHVTGVAAWLGGLLMLLLVAFPSVRGLDAGERVRLLAPVVGRFSDLAVVAVLAVLATGVYSAWVEIRTLSAVTASTYGLVFLAKIGALLPVLALGAVNNRWTKPRLLAAAARDDPGAAPLTTLRHLVAIEVALIAVVIGLTAYLLSLTPPVRLMSAIA